MSLKFSSHQLELELLHNTGGRGTGNRFSIRDVHHAKRTLSPLLEQDKDLHRLRGFLAWSRRWHGLEKRRNAEVLDQVAEALYRGSLYLEIAPTRAPSAIVASPKPPEDAQENEEWVEIAPEPVAAEEEPETFVVTQESALALAENNRELAASGAPFKEICTIKDCKVCNAQLTVMAN